MRPYVMRRLRAQKWLVAAALSFLSLTCPAAPVLLHTASHEAPVRGDPGELLLIQGYGFKATDQVVYEAFEGGDASAHPAAVPPATTADRGSAAIVSRADPPYSITVQLPDVMTAGRPYRLWVVDRAGQWSDCVAINDPRPLWITPAVLYASADRSGLGRTVRVVGRNLQQGAGSAAASWIRLRGPASYDLAVAANQPDPHLGAFVREGVAPTRLLPGRYAVSISDDGRNWLKIADQQLEVRPDPPPLPHFDITDARFGACKPDDGLDDSECLTRALDAARLSGGAVITFGAGRWDLSSGRGPNGFVVAPNVHLEGAIQGTTLLLRHGAKQATAPGALFTLNGLDSITGITFTDDATYANSQESRTTIQLGSASAAGAAAAGTDDVQISGSSFLRVGRAMTAGGQPIHRLIVTHNVFGAFDTALMLTGAGADPFVLEDSVFRDNRFVPGSFLDISARQGTVATQIGASKRVDFSGNTADGAATEGLQTPQDARGWRAAFFWSMANSNEDLLIADNRISCSGDKAGDGEAISLDGNGGTYAFDSVQVVEAAGAGWVRVHAIPAHMRKGHSYPDGYFTGHWLTVVDGAGVGQTRKIQSYSEDPVLGTTTFRIAPYWDLIPQASRGRIVVSRQYWQVYVVGNRVDHRSAPCRKSNLNSPRGGVIGLWTQIADSVVAGNEQHDTDGIEFLQAYNAHVPSCPACDNDVAFVTALEIRDNRVDGEYDWSSDCSWSGIRGYFVAAPTPESPPPWLGVGIVISGNEITHADGVRGGAIEIARAGQTGPPPGKWPIAQNILIYGNYIRDISGPAPRNACGLKQTARSGIRIEGDENIRNTVLKANRCEHVDVPLQDSGTATARICSASDAQSCECRQN